MSEPPSRRPVGVYSVKPGTRRMEDRLPTGQRPRFSTDEVESIVREAKESTAVHDIRALRVEVARVEERLIEVQRASMLPPSPEPTPAEVAKLVPLGTKVAKVCGVILAIASVIGIPLGAYISLQKDFTETLRTTIEESVKTQTELIDLKLKGISREIEFLRERGR